MKYLTFLSFCILLILSLVVFSMHLVLFEMTLEVKAQQQHLFSIRADIAYNKALINENTSRINKAIGEQPKVKEN